MTLLRNKFDLLRQKLKGWKTVIFGTFVSIAGAVLDTLESLRAIDIAPLLPSAHAMRIIAAIGVVTILLRVFTTGAVGEKDR